MSEEPLHYDNAPLHMGRLCHLIEQSEERILQSNATLAKLGAAGILSDQILLGPLIAYVGVKDVVRHLSDIYPLSHLPARGAGRCCVQCGHRSAAQRFRGLGPVSGA